LDSTVTVSHSRQQLHVRYNFCFVLFETT
jgi:hypothetical protein